MDVFITTTDPSLNAKEVAYYLTDAGYEVARVRVSDDDGIVRDDYSSSDEEVMNENRNEWGLKRRWAVYEPDGSLHQLDVVADSADEVYEKVHYASKHDGWTVAEQRWPNTRPQR